MSLKKWDVLESDYIYKTPFGNLRADKCLLPNGKIIEKYYINEHREWVNVVAITADKQMVFVRQYRHGCKDFVLEVPAGIIETIEDAETAALRELREETGYVSDKKPALLGEFFANPALATNKVRIFLIEEVRREFEQHTDDTEEIEVETYPFDEVGSLIQKGFINQLFTVCAYFLARDYLERKSQGNGSVSSGNSHSVLKSQFNIK